MDIPIIDTEKQTIEYYDKNANKWGLTHSNSAFWEAELKLFKQYLPHGSVLEIGSGVGRDAIELIQMGYTYTGIDASVGLVKVAQTSVPDAEFLIQNIYDLQFPQARFDGFWCAAMLLHIPKNKIHLALDQIKSVVKKGAIGFISIKEGAGEYCDESTKRTFYLYDATEFSDVLVKNGFTVLKQGHRTPSAIHTTDAQWLTFFVQV